MNVADDIQIGIDASDALSGINKLGSAFETLAKQAGLPDKVVNSSMKGLERSIESVNAAVAKRVVLSQQATRAATAEANATDRLAQAQARATAKTGMTAQFKADGRAGQVRNAATGRFASPEQSEGYYRELALQQKLIRMGPQLDRMRQRNAEVAYQSSQKAAAATRQESDAYKTRQAQLEKAFKGNIVGLAAPDATRWQRFSNVLSQIPPVAMAGKLAAVQQSIMGMSNSTRYALYDVSSSFGIAGAAIAGFGVASIAAAVAHERAFANVARTTQTSAQGYEAIQRQLELMAMSLPTSFEGLTEIASAAGQLGIQASGVAAFTSVVAKLSATTNLTADAAGTALARFKAFFSEADAPGMAVTEATFSNLASSILKVGVNSIASETGIVNVGIQIASMADYAGYTANQVIGLAGALSSIGVAPELARGTITRTFSNIGNAVSESGVRLEKFAALSGMSAADFKKSWGTDDFANTFTKLIAGIKGVSDSGGDANLTLQELGFNSVRDRPLLLRLAEAADEAGNSGGLMAQTMRDALSGWTENSELAIQYSKIANTTSARIQVLGQAFEQLAATMGQQSGGFLGEMAVQLTNVVKGFEAFSNSDAGQVLGTIAVQGALVVGALMLVIAGAARGAASLQGIGTAWNDIRNSTNAATTAVGKFGTAMKIANLSLGLLGVAATIAAVVGGWIAMTDANEKANRAIQDTSGFVAAMKADAEAGAEGITFYGQVAKDTSKQSDALTDAIYGTGTSAKSSANDVDAMSASAGRLKYVFGDTAKALYRSSLIQSEAVQKLFNPDTQFSEYGDFTNFLGQGKTLKDMGFRPEMLDWDGLFEESLKGGVDTDKLFDKLLPKMGGEKNSEAVRDFVNQIASAVGNIGGDVQSQIDVMAAFGSTSQQAFQSYSEGALTAAEAMAQMDEVTQQAVNAMAAGFAKFGDTGNLIKLTQQFGEIAKAADPEAAEQAAAAYETAWTNAYGGAAFSLSDFLAVQARANSEQQSFVNGLGELQARAANLGLSDAFIGELSAMGPEAAALVDALVAGTDGQLQQFVENFRTTGYDATVAMAVQMELGNQIIANIMADGGSEALARFNAKLASGVGVDQALAELQRDVDGKPIEPKATEPNIPFLSAWQKQRWSDNNRLYTTATVTVNQVQGASVGGIQIDPGYATGGYTGNGGKFDPAGTVHKGEFVMTAAATRAIGVGNLYSMMKAAQGGRSAPRGRGYASGGSVSGNSGPNIVYLSPQDRELLRSLQPIVMLGDRDIARANGNANFRTTRQGVG